MRGNKRTPEEEAGGVESTEEITRRLRESSPNGHRIEPFDESALMENLHLTNAYFDKNLPGEATSNRRVLGPFYRLFKRIVWRLSSWYINPAIDNQRLFNAYATRSINEMKRYLDHLQINEDILSTIMRRDLALFRANILFLVRYLENRMLDFENELELLSSSSAAGTAIAPEVAVVGNGGESETKDLLGALDILSLEQRVHGSPKAVKDRQKVYLPYFRECGNVLAIGCGRGELLQLPAQEGISVKGIETNPTLVAYCRDQGRVGLDPFDGYPLLSQQLQQLALAAPYGEDVPAPAEVRQVHLLAVLYRLGGTVHPLLKGENVERAQEVLRLAFTAVAHNRHLRRNRGAGRRAAAQQLELVLKIQHAVLEVPDQEQYVSPEKREVPANILFLVRYLENRML